MNIVISGGSGFIGTTLTEKLLDAGHNITIISRSLKVANREKVNYAVWETDAYFQAIQQADVVINLAGENIGGKLWTASQKQNILNSRITCTRSLVNQINQRTSSNVCSFISASAVGIYGNRDDEQVDESSKPGEGFVAEVCKQWEQEAAKVDARKARIVITRAGLVLDKKEGALPRIALPVKLFFGGKLGPGNQFISWIHLDDVIGMYLFFIENKNTEGIYNLTSPNPVTNEEFIKTLGRILKRPTIIPAPVFGIKMLVGEMSELVLYSQKILPNHATNDGYAFKYTFVENALREIYL